VTSGSRENLPILSMAGIPLLVASLFDRVFAAFLVGAALLVVDLFFVPRGEYEGPWKDLVHSKGLEKGLVIAILAAFVLGPLLGGFLPIVSRGFIRTFGVTSKGVIEEKISSLEIPHDELKISYSTQSGQRLSGRSYWIPELRYDQSVRGQSLSIHYLPWYPRWFALDEIPPENAAFFLPLALSLVLFLLWFALRIVL